MHSDHQIAVAGMVTNIVIALIHGGELRPIEVEEKFASVYASIATTMATVEELRGKKDDAGA